jgi:GT2 family glycosyltransferase
MGLSVLTLVRNREAHLHQLVEGLRRSRRQPDELIVIDMSDAPLASMSERFPVVIERLRTTGLPLAAARNRAAALARHDQLVFLDVDCIPMAGCLDRLCEALDEVDGLLCADIRYLGPDDARGRWTETDLLARGQSHPVRTFPREGLRAEDNAGLFWSLAFAIHRTSFRAIDGFDERFEGYGAEDTDFGFRATAAGIPLFFVGGAIACHQHHDSHEPPVQHVRDIVHNARLFHARWGRWPMEGWLEAFDAMGLVEWRADTLLFRRLPTPDEQAATRVSWASVDDARQERQPAMVML